jgi:hypothetical protein
MALLAAETLHLGNRHTFHADFRKCFLNLFKLEGLYDGDDQFHAILLVVC